MDPSYGPTAPPGDIDSKRSGPDVRHRRVRALSLLLLLVGLAGYASSASVVLLELQSPPWWSWLWLAVPATVASWLVLLGGRSARS